MSHDDLSTEQREAIYNSDPELREMMAELGRRFQHNESLGDLDARVTQHIGEVAVALGFRPEIEKCGARATFWPDDEGCEAECILPRGHDPAGVHRDEILGEWDEDELLTIHPES